MSLLISLKSSLNICMPVYSQLHDHSSHEILLDSQQNLGLFQGSCSHCQSASYNPLFAALSSVVQPVMFSTPHELDVATSVVVVVSAATAM